MEKFKKSVVIMEIYHSLDSIKDRKDRYEEAERQYQKKYREKAYDDFRTFQALLSISYSEEVPHNSSVKNYVKR